MRPVVVGKIRSFRICLDGRGVPPPRALPYSGSGRTEEPTADSTIACG